MSTDTTASQDHRDQVFSLIMGGLASQAVRALCVLSVAEHLAEGPLLAAEIARRESTDPRMTFRLLRVAVGLGLLRHDPEAGTFSATPALSILHPDSPVSLKHYALTAGSEAFWLPAVLLPETLAKGANHVVEALGCSIFEYFARHEDDARVFSAAMTNLSLPVIREAVEIVDASEGLAIDVGGAEGAFVCELVQHNPGLRGAVLELPHAVPGAQAEAARRGLGDRVQAIAGDFFQSVPEGEVYLLKFVLHDWDDESCVTILRNIRGAMRPGARVYVVETTIAPVDPSPVAVLFDLAMLQSTTGQERELGEFEALLGAADLQVRRVVPVSTPYHVIEAVAR